MPPLIGRPKGALAPALVALVAFLPFVRGVVSGQSFYFRDLSLYYFPLRRFVVEGLRVGELRYWNPYVHEGVQELFPPISYPAELLQALFPHEAWFSLLLALHVPLAALACFMLARGLGLSALAAAAGGLAYALGGFGLSALNLYEHLHALAWAPLVVLALVRAARGGHRSVATAALLVAMALSTGRAETAAQAVAVGLVLSWSGRDPREGLRLGSSLALGAGLAAPTLVAMHGLIAESARGQGFPTDVVLAHSVHPLTFLQVIIGNLYGDLTDVANRWWGQNFSPRGFPYILSLYLGLTVLCLALVGAFHGRTLRRRLVLIALLAAFVCLGRWGGLESVVDLLPSVRRFRYPTKAFFSVHLAVALLAALGLDALVTDPGRGAWRKMALSGLASGALLASTVALPWLLPGATRWFLGGFFPPDASGPQRVAFLRVVLHDAVVGGLLALAAGAIAALVLLGRMPRRGAPLALVSIVAVDLLRTGAGLNPMVTSSFFGISREMSREVARLTHEGGRVFTCDFASSAAFLQARQTVRGRHEVWTFATLMETLTPYHNVSRGIATAGSLDMTMLVPVDRLLQGEEGCRDLDATVGRLRAAAVAHVISLDPLSHPELAPHAVVAPQRIAPLSIYVYDLLDPLPLRFVATRALEAAGREEAEILAREPGFQGGGGVAVEGLGKETPGATGRILSWRETPGRIEMSVEADRPTVVVSREAYARGWSAWVDDSPAPVLRADGRHCAVQIPSGTSRVLLRYRPPYVTAAAGLSAVALAILGLLWRAGRPVPPQPTL